MVNFHRVALFSAALVAQAEAAHNGQVMKTIKGGLDISAPRALSNGNPRKLTPRAEGGKPETKKWRSFSRVLLNLFYHTINVPILAFMMCSYSPTKETDSSTNDTPLCTWIQDKSEAFREFMGTEKVEDKKKWPQKFYEFLLAGSESLDKSVSPLLVSLYLSFATMSLRSLGFISILVGIYTLLFLLPLYVHHSLLDKDTWWGKEVFNNWAGPASSLVGIANKFFGPVFKFLGEHIFFLFSKTIPEEGDVSQGEADSTDIIKVNHKTVLAFTFLTFLLSFIF